MPSDLLDESIIRPPCISIVMPVFNTGAVLRDSVDSVVSQTLFSRERADYWELLVIDDGSTDPETIALLGEIAALSGNIRVIKNDRRKGPGGARNAGLYAACGEWIAFLDSDDLWYVNFLEALLDAFGPYPQARWRSAHFHVGDDLARPALRTVAERSPCLYRKIKDSYDRSAVATLTTPVDVLLECGCVGVMTVQIARELMIAAGGFDEDFPSAEDYDLWVRVASKNDLYIAPIDAGVYRVRSGSLTKSGRPMYYNEDKMLLKAKSNDDFVRFRTAIDRRLAKVYLTYCYHFRNTGNYKSALAFAKRLVALSPLDPAGWRQLAASIVDLGKAAIHGRH